MKLLRKINNNAAVAQDNRGREMVVLGRGVGFHPMPYELTDLSVVYRTFYDVDPQYYEILSNLPEDALLAAADITEQAEITLHTELNPNLPFTLADHIAFAQQREKQGIRMAAPLHYDVQHLSSPRVRAGPAGTGDRASAYQFFPAPRRGRKHCAAYRQCRAGRQ